MRFATILSTVQLASAATIAYNPAALTTLNQAADQLGGVIAAVNSLAPNQANFDQIALATQGIFSSLQLATAQLLNGPYLGPFGAPTFVPVSARLDFQVHQLTNALEAKKPLADSLGRSAQIAAILQQEYIASSQLVNAFQQKIPSLYFNSAAPAILEIPRRLGKTWNIYNNLPTTSPIPAVAPMTPEVAAQLAPVAAPAAAYGAAPVVLGNTAAAYQAPAPVAAAPALAPTPITSIGPAVGPAAAFAAAAPSAANPAIAA